MNDHRTYVYDATCPRCRDPRESAHEHLWRADGRCGYEHCDARYDGAWYGDGVRQPDRPEPVDPATVRRGDYVEYETVESGLADPLFIRALVVDIKFDGGSFLIAGAWRNGDPSYATVRVLRQAEPEPDSEQVRWIAAVLVEQLGPEIADLVDLSVPFEIDMNPAARELVRRGVTVPEGRP